MAIIYVRGIWTVHYGTLIMDFNVLNHGTRES